MAKEIKNEAIKKVKITFKVIANVLDGDTLSIVGNIKELGEWNPKKGVKLNLKENVYEVSKMLEIGTEVSFKIVKNASWEFVEKNYDGFDIANHDLIVDAKREVEIFVEKI